MPPAPRISIRKRHGFNLGHRTVICKIGPQKKKYSVHENLLCKTSTFFRNAIQPNRRDVEGDCSICHEELRLGIDDLTYCSASCGGNFHEKCIEGWKQQAVARARCPLCRHEWKQSSLPIQNLSTISERGFEIYVNWLYRNRILAIAEDTDACYDELVDAYTIGQHLDDEAFCKNILKSIVEVSAEDDCFPSTEIVETAYESTKGPCDLRELLVGLYMRLNTDEDDLTEEDIRELPVEFVRDLSMAFLRAVPAEKKLWTLEALTASVLPRTTVNDEQEEHEENEPVETT